MPRASKPVTVTLGKFDEFVEDRVRSGRYSSASEVVRAGLRALQREEAHLDEWMIEKIKESLADPRPGISAEDVFAELRARNAARAAADAKQR